MINDIIYDHYIAIDWSIRNMAIARVTKKSDKINCIDVPTDIAELKVYLKTLQGTKILVVEESTTSQWLYTEIRSYVDRMIVCDPHRNRLLSEGPKTDKIDARKLVRLLRAGLVKEVYHSSKQFIYLRRTVSGYEDLVKSGVRLKNQRKALFRSCGMKGSEKGNINIESKEDQNVLESIDRQIALYEQEKERYEKEFDRLVRKYSVIKHQKSLPGIGAINAVKIVSRVVTPDRFANKGHFLSYAGLIKLEKMSGGKSYGRRKSRYCRQLKNIYKTGVLAALDGKNAVSDYYKYLLFEKKYPEYHARHKACRMLAVLSLGVLRSGKRYNHYRNVNISESGNIKNL